MDRTTFESQKAFAGEKKASMQRRCVDNDYTARRMQMKLYLTNTLVKIFGSTCLVKEFLQQANTQIGYRLRRRSYKDGYRANALMSSSLATCPKLTVLWSRAVTSFNCLDFRLQK